MGVKAIDIDKAKLQRAIEIRGLNASEMSRAMGYDRGYIASSMHYGRMGLPGVLMLEKMYDIIRDEYEKLPEPKEEPQEKEEPAVKFEVTEIDYDELYKCIYSAVYEAVKKAWSE